MHAGRFGRAAGSWRARRARVTRLRHPGAEVGPPGSAMRFEYEVSPEHAVQAELDAIEASAAARRSLRSQTLWSGATVAIFGFVYLAVLGGSPGVVAAVGLLGGLVTSLTTYGLTLSQRRRMARSLVAEAWGDPRPVRAELVLDERGPWLRIGEATITCPWSSIEWIESMPRGLRLRGHAGLRIGLPDRALPPGTSREDVIGRIDALRAAVARGDG